MGPALDLTSRRPGPPWSPDALVAADFPARNGLFEGRNVPVHEAFTVSRSASRLCRGPDGDWATVGPDVPALEPGGLSVEPEATNWVPNGALAGAFASTNDALNGLPTGWDRVRFDGVAIKGRVLETGTWMGLPSITVRLWGESSVDDAEIRGFTWADTASNLVVAHGERVQASVFGRVVGGSLANIDLRQRITERTGAGDFLAKRLASFDLSATERPSHVFTIGHANAGLVLSGIEIGFSGAFDCTLEIAAPHLVVTDQAVPTSPILTSVGPVTRQADIVVPASEPLAGTAHFMRPESGQIHSAALSGAPLGAAILGTGTIERLWLV